MLNRSLNNHLRKISLALPLFFFLFIWLVPHLSTTGFFFFSPTIPLEFRKKGSLTYKHLLLKKKKKKPNSQLNIKTNNRRTSLKLPLIYGRELSKCKWIHKSLGRSVGNLVIPKQQLITICVEGKAVWWRLVLEWPISGKYEKKKKKSIIKYIVKYASDKTISSPIKYSQKYLWIRSPYHAKFASVLLQNTVYFLPCSPTSRPQTGITPLQQHGTSRKRKENDNELPKRIQRINSREKGRRPRFDTFQFTLWHWPLPNCYKNNLLKPFIETYIHVLPGVQKWREPKTTFSWFLSLLKITLKNLLHK